jgi:hypothetical protein
VLVPRWDGLEQRDAGPMRVLDAIPTGWIAVAGRLAQMVGVGECEPIIDGRYSEECEVWRRVGSRVSEGDCEAFAYVSAGRVWFGGQLDATAVQVHFEFAIESPGQSSAERGSRRGVLWSRSAWFWVPETGRVSGVEEEGWPWPDGGRIGSGGSGDSAPAQWRVASRSVGTATEFEGVLELPSNTAEDATVRMRVVRDATAEALRRGWRAGAVVLGPRR